MTKNTTIAVRGYNPDAGNNMFFLSAWGYGFSSQDQFLVIRSDEIETVKRLLSRYEFQPYTTANPNSPPPPLNAPMQSAANGDHIYIDRVYYNYIDQHGKYRTGFNTNSYHIYNPNGAKAAGAAALMMEIVRTVQMYQDWDDRQRVSQHAAYIYKAAEKMDAAVIRLPDFVKNDQKMGGQIVNCMTDGRLPPVSSSRLRSRYNSVEYQRVVAQFAKEILSYGADFVYERIERLVEDYSEPLPSVEQRLDASSYPQVDRPRYKYEIFKPTGFVKKYVDAWNTAFPDVLLHDDKVQKVDKEGYGRWR